MEKQPRRHEDTKKNRKKLDGTDEAIAREIIDAGFSVYRNLGPGLLEKICEKCFCHELDKRGIRYQCQMPVPIIHDDVPAFRHGVP